MPDVDRIASRIVAVRGRRVIVDADLAALYGVPTKRLNQQVRRNPKRFPADFVFRLSDGERAEVVAKCDHLARLRFSVNLPLVYTEHGALMASSVLKTRRAVEVSLHVVRALVQMRNALAAHREIAGRLDQLERRVGSHDQTIVEILRALRELMRPAEPPKRRRIGFVRDD